MLKIYLMRHGQDEDNVKGILNGHRDKPLTNLGIEQAGITANYCKDGTVTFDKVYSSPLKRAYTTAEIISDALLLPKPEILDELKERDFGVMTGKLVSKISELCSPDVIKVGVVTYFLSPEGAETFPQTFARAQSVLSHLKKNHQDGSVLVVTHGDIGKMIYAGFYNLHWKDVLQKFHFGNCELLLLSESSPSSESHIFSQGQYNH